MSLISAGLSGKQATLTTSTALNVASVTAATVTATTGMTITGGRGNVATWGAQLRVVSSNSSILTAPPQITWGVNGEDHVAWEYNYLGFGSHFWRTSAANSWSESARVTSNNKWTFWSGTQAAEGRGARPTLRRVLGRPAPGVRRELPSQRPTRDHAKDRLHRPRRRGGPRAKSCEHQCYRPKKSARYRPGRRKP